MAHFVPLNTAVHPQHSAPGWQLLLQRALLFGTEPEQQMGYRNIWRRENGSLSVRPCRVDSFQDVIALWVAAFRGGWGHHDGGVHKVVRRPMLVTIDGVETVLNGDAPGKPIRVTIEGADQAGARAPSITIKAS